MKLKPSESSWRSSWRKSSQSVQPLENETVMMKVAEEAEAEATTEHMDINLDDTQKEPLEKLLDHLVSSNDDEAEPISELLEVQLEEEVSASVQPLENETTMMVADETEAEATTEHVSTHLEETEEEPHEKRLHLLVSSKDDATEAIREVLEVQLEEEVSDGVQPLENETVMIVAEEAEAEATTEPMDINLDDLQQEPLEKHLDEMNIKKKDPRRDQSICSQNRSRRAQESMQN
ncbi:hypothetical protein MHYP_G00170980 [Metynnis hypsauchen]